jgi:hypothetical protein
MLPRFVGGRFRCPMVGCSGGRRKTCDSMRKSHSGRYRAVCGNFHVRRKVCETPQTCGLCFSRPRQPGHQVPEQLVRFFSGRTTDDNLPQVFSFIEHYIDTAKWEPLGRYYLERFYENLCLRKKLYLDWETSGKCGDKNSRVELHNFIAELADQEQFKNVSKEFP